jgi:hypothetical protein
MIQCRINVNYCILFFRVRDIYTTIQVYIGTMAQKYREIFNVVSSIVEISMQILVAHSGIISILTVLS